jgi:hypothetical protein
LQLFNQRSHHLALARHEQRIALIVYAIVRDATGVTSRITITLPYHNAAVSSLQLAWLLLVLGY